jgi:ribulose-phosphate 3-epimerase
MKREIIPAILTRDIRQLQAQLRALEGASHSVHIDIMDGIFVPHQTITLEDLAAVDTILNIELHLMVVHPERYLEVARATRARKVIVHFEATQDPNGVIHQISSYGMKRGMAINPETSVEKIVPFGKSLDQITVLGGTPGTSGQTMLETTYDKIKDLSGRFSRLPIEIDIGVKADNIEKLKEAGASLFVSHKAVFEGGNPKEALQNLASRIAD